ncbi:MAG: hypothetical protein JXB26_03790 [Candidatus Aminicenantes bacterium]|nr:hypothetical protein [Candidatus Aminicenantes bacterium]
MNIFWLVYIVVFICGLTFFFAYVRGVRSRLEKTGRNRILWIAHLMFSFPLNLFTWSVFAAYFGYNLYSILVLERYYFGCTGFLLILFLLLFLARYHIAVGEKGILFHESFVPWKKIVSVKRKAGLVKWINVTWEQGVSSQEKKSKKFIVPGRLFRSLSLHIEKMLSSENN